MKAIPARHVLPAADPRCLSEGPHGRSGTALAPESAMVAILGEPDRTDHDEKVSVRWFLRTPRGLVCVRDYWWNREGEWTLAGPRKATLWAASWLRANGVRAAFGVAGQALQNEARGNP